MHKKNALYKIKAPRIKCEAQKKGKSRPGRETQATPLCCGEHAFARSLCVCFFLIPD